MPIHGQWTYWRERHARAVAQNPHALKNGRRKVCFCLLSWRIYFKSKIRKIPLNKLNKMQDCLEDFWKRRSKTGKLKLFQPLSWMNTLANSLSSPSQTSLRSLTDLVFEKTRKVLQSEKMVEKLNRSSCLVKFCWFGIIAQAGRVSEGNKGAVSRRFCSFRSILP